MESTKPATFHLNTFEDSDQVKNLIVDQFKAKNFLTVELVALDCMIDTAVQLAIMIKNELQHGLHQTTHLSLVQSNHALTKQIFTLNFG